MLFLSEGARSIPTTRLYFTFFFVSLNSTEGDKKKCREVRLTRTRTNLCNSSCRFSTTVSSTWQKMTRQIFCQIGFFVGRCEPENHSKCFRMRETEKKEGQEGSRQKCILRDRFAQQTRSGVFNRIAIEVRGWIEIKISTLLLTIDCFRLLPRMRLLKGLYKIPFFSYDSLLLSF